MPLADSVKFRSYLPVVLGAGAAVCLIAAYRLRFRQPGSKRRHQLQLAQPLICFLLSEGPEAGPECESSVVCKFGDVSCRLVVKDRRRVLEKLETMVQDGVENLEVITDFDHTLSKFLENGRRVPSCHGILEAYPTLSAEDHKYFKEKYAKYYAIEICPKLTEEEKVPHMIEWWSLSHDRMVRGGIQQSVLAQTVDSSGVALRDGWRQFFDLVNRHEIPCLIFSAGIGDIIQEILAQFGIDGRLIRLVSNFMRFDEKGFLQGFSEPLIHTFNKRFSAFGTDAAAATTVRRNVLLMGDTTGDLRMAEGTHADLVLTVGYLNDKVDARLPVYAASFDIVCVEDSTLSVPLAVLEAVVAGAPGGNKKCSGNGGSSGTSRKH